MSSQRSMTDNVPIPLRSLNALSFPNASTPPTPGRHLRLVTSGESGRHGEPGRDGSTGGQPGWRGEDGQPGAHASPISLSLYLHEEAVIIARHAVANFNPVESALHLADPYATIFLEAVGGAGGHGGKGGKGANGAYGVNGKNATQYSDATAGGPGQNGGRGGDGGNGGHGGCGGDIAVNVNEQDMDLLVLVKTPPDARGGAAGVGGDGGEGGRGGAGGKGGRGYEWTEPSNISGQAQTVQRSRPGARDGPPGARGQDGRRGVDGGGWRGGGVVWRVNEVGEFGWRYDLRVCPDVGVVDELGYGVLQPGDVVGLLYSVENCGGMPSPSFQDVSMSIEPGPWAVPLGIGDCRGLGVVTLPRRIPPGLVVRIPKPIGVMLSEVVAPLVGEPLVKSVELRHRAVVSRVNQATGITLTFPLHMSALVGNVCALHGGEAFMAWSIKNICNADIGVEAALARNAQVRLVYVSPEDRGIVDDRSCTIWTEMSAMGHLSQSPELHPSEFEVGSCNMKSGAAQREDPSQGAVLPISMIAAGEELLFVCSVRVNPDGSQEDMVMQDSERFPKYYSQACVTTFLDLGHPQSLLALQPIQCRPFQVQVAQPFTYHEGKTKVLLVVNNRTTPSEIEKWNSLAVGLMGMPEGSGIAVWNTSLYGGFSFKYKISELGITSTNEKRKTLGSLFSGEDSLVVILNNTCSPTGIRTSNVEYCPMQVLKRHEILHACKYYNCSVYIPGSSAGVALHSRVRVPVDSVVPFEFESPDELLKGIVPVFFPGRESSISSQARGDPKTSSAAWLSADLKGPLYKQKRKGRGRVKRVFILRKEIGQLLYFNKANSQKPSATFFLADCSLSTNPVPDNADGTKDETEAEILTILTPSRELKLQAVTSKGNVVGPSLAEWRAEITDGILLAKKMAPKDTSNRENVEDLIQDHHSASSDTGDPRFDQDIPEGFDRYGLVKIITRQMNVKEGMIRKKAEEVAAALSGQYPEFPCLVVYRYVEKSEQEKNDGIMFNKRNIGDISVHLGLPRGHGQAVGECAAEAHKAQASNEFVHEQVLSDRNKYGVLKALPIGQKTRLLRDARQDGFLTGDEEGADSISLTLLISAILSDAADEHAAFRFGSVSTLEKMRQAFNPSKKRDEAEAYGQRMSCLATICAEGNIGTVTAGSKKFEEVFRLCSTLRMLVGCSVPNNQKVFKVSRVGLIARASGALLTKLENNFAAALGLADASEIQHEGQTIGKCAALLLKQGLADGNKKITHTDLLSFLRCRYGFGIADADSKGGAVHPIVLPFADYAAAKERDEKISLPNIPLPETSLSDERRKQKLLDFLADNGPRQEPSIVSL